MRLDFNYANSDDEAYLGFDGEDWIEQCRREHRRLQAEQRAENCRAAEMIDGLRLREYDLGDML